MTRAYLRLDPGFAERKAHYPDGAFRALVETLCLAEFQPMRGRFRSRQVLKALLEKRGRWLPYLLEQGDVIEAEGGRLVVDGWDEWQEGDVTVQERMRRLRQRNARRNNDRNGGRNATANSSNTLSKESGGVAIAAGRNAPATMSDDERREHLDQLRSTLEGLGAAPMKANGVTSAMPSDEELVARYRAIRDDDGEADWRRQAAKTALEAMGAR